ncbi:MAG: glycosyl hydrolase family 32 [Bacteroidales bacterium]|nr:glycosyl hydrolase family 32 [Bacteroidales bacterium]
MKRREFLKKTALTGASFLLLPRTSFPAFSESGELLYNGIRLPAVWPPRNMDGSSYEPMPVPYLDNPPRVIPIDVGRQLFVDDFLIESTDLKRAFHKAKKYAGNPVLKPETPLEKGHEHLPLACPKDGGIWWDPADKVFKMWYEAAWIGAMAYATSKDGIHWERPDLGIQPGTNQILPEFRPDSTTVFLDHDAKKPGERFKMFFREPDWTGKNYGTAMVSGDGIHWNNPVPTGSCGDRSTMFYNPFRKKWVYSIRTYTKTGRSRQYHEHADFLKGAKWVKEDTVFWTGADKLDPPDPNIGNKAQLYNLSAVAYESLMLGIHEIHLGPANEVCQKQGTPKITDLKIAFSRDGFHWHRPDRGAFISSTRQEGSWERGYVQPVGGICHIVGDQLWFYYIGFEGDPANHHQDAMKSGMYANGSTGIAILRRDGFASMSAGTDGGSLTTRPVTFQGKYLFVNVDCPKGQLKVDILDENNAVMSTFSAESCQAVSIDSTICQIQWDGKRDLSGLIGQKVHFRFHLTDGHLYSFWVSPDPSGASHGYVAAGGPGFKGSRDKQGLAAYKYSAPAQLGL